MLATIMLILIIFYTTFLTDKTEDWVGWTVLALAVVAGAAIGFLMYKCQKLGAAMLAAFGGFLLGMTLCTTFLWATQSSTLFWVISSVFAVIGAVCAFFFFFPMVIFVTAFGGSYLFVRGISLYAGGYPNEFTVMNQLKSGAIDFSYWFYLYLGFIIIFTIGTTMYQCRHFKNNVDSRPKHPFADH